MSEEEKERKERRREMRPTIPETGIWTLYDLGLYLEMSPADLQERLQAKGIPVLVLGQNYKRRLIRLRDLKKERSDD